jgi:chromosome partitioning protein
MTIVVVGNTKGGVGKTTLAVQVALSRQLAGRAVLLIDTDQQGSSQNAAAMRAEAGRQPPLACVQLAEGRLVRAQLTPLAAQHDDVVIDAGGRDTQALRIALLRSDLLIVPVQPRAVDVWALSDMADLVTQAQEARDDEGRPRLRALAALNLTDPGDNRDTTDTVAALAGFPQFTIAKAIIRRRKAVANAMALGLFVGEMQPRDAKAVEEIELLVSNVFDVTEDDNGHHTAIEAE